MKIRPNDIRSLIKSFGYAFRGLFFCVANERNMRIHVVFTVYVLAGSLFYNLSRAEYALLIGAIALVIITEMLNTAIETLTNLASPAYNNLARIAKDIAAGAVLMAAILAVVVGFLLLFDLETIAAVLRFVFLDIWHLLVFVCVSGLAVLFVFRGFHFSGKAHRPYFSNKGDKT